MRRETLVLPSYPRYSVLDRLYGQSRSVQAKVFDGAREVDSFQSSSPETLWETLRPVLKHLPSDASLQFTGVEERWLPLGIRYWRREVCLSGPEAALAFLLSRE